MSEQQQDIIVVDDPAPAQEVEVVEVPAALGQFQPDQLADRVSWVINRIADKGFNPGLPDRAWAGRQDVIADVVKKYEVSVDTATAMVAEAVHALRLADPAMSDKDVHKQLQLQRLENLRQLILRVMSQNVTETTYAFDDVEGTGENAGKTVQKRRRVKEKVSPPDIGAFSGRLLDIMRMENDLRGLTGPGADASIATRGILEEMEKTVDEQGNAKTRRKMSVVNTVRVGDVSRLHPDSQRRYLETVHEAAAQARQKAAKPVASTEAKPAE